LKTFKAWWAKDRWTIVRIVHLTPHGWASAKETHLSLRNKYSGKVKLMELDGHWTYEDFPGNIYRGAKYTS
jgi:hypothetical protein